MALTIGSNIASLLAQRRLGQSSTQLESVFERLSSGQRINRASDDAAGLAIAESLSADRRIYAQGVRNISDGISVLSIADSALEELSKVVTRLQELATQSSNGSFSNEQRKALDEEAQSLGDEYLRIVQSTEFNGKKILNGDLGTLQIQAGSGNNAILEADIGGATATGTFGVAITIGSDSNNNSAAADFDFDGNLDIARWNGTTVEILQGDGNGNFTQVASFSSTDVDNVVARDFDGDGALDLAITNGTAGSISTFLNNGSGSFSFAATYQAGASGAASQGTQSVQAADINSDGFEDLALLNSNDSTLQILFGQLDGIFSQSVSYSMASGVEGWCDLELGDFNGDGSVDIIANSEGTDEVVAFYGDGSGTFSTVQTVSFNAAGVGRDIAVGDINKDGFDDFVYVESNNDQLIVALGQSDGTFSIQQTIDVEQFTSISLAAKLADINGDGYLDLASADLSTSLDIYYGDGSGNFAEGERQSTIANARLDTFADFNNDGVLDYTVASGSGSYFSVVLQETESGMGALTEFSLETLADARQAIPVFERTLQQLAEQRGFIGSALSRFEVASNNLKSLSENYAQAEDRIRSADIASEAAQLVRLQILQQASAAVLGQANQQPALAVQLLS